MTMADQQQPNGQGTQAIQKRQDPAASFIQMLDRAKGELQRAATKHLDVERMSRLAITVVRRNPDLLTCTPVSFLASVMQATQLGLELDGVLGRAYLVPFKNKGRKECQLIIGYKGMIELALRSGVVETVEANVVYEGDEFEYEEGLNRKLRHVPKFLTDDPEKLTHAYAIVRFKGGGVLFKALPKAFFARKKKDTDLWKNHYAVACMKTVIRWLFKFMPASSEVARAVALEERHEEGLTQLVDADVIDVDPVELQGEYRAPDEPSVEEVPPGKIAEGAQQAPAGPPKTTDDLKARSTAEKLKERAQTKEAPKQENKPEPAAAPADDDDMPGDKPPGER